MTREAEARRSRLDGGRRERSLAAHGGGASFNFDIGAHAHQFLDVHEAILKDVFGPAGAFGLRGKRHVLRLHVGGEARIFLSGRCRQP